MVLGRVLSAKFDSSKLPLIYTRGNYRRLSRASIPSGRAKVRVSLEDLRHFAKLAAGQFVLKTAVCVAKSGDRVLLQRFGNSWILPFVVVKKGENYVRILDRFMRSSGMPSRVGRISTLARLSLTDGKSSIRANFVAFRCRVQESDGDVRLKWFDRLPRNTLLRKQLLKDA